MKGERFLDRPSLCDNHKRIRTLPSTLKLTDDFRPGVLKNPKVSDLASGETDCEFWQMFSVRQMFSVQGG